MAPNGITYGTIILGLALGALGHTGDETAAHSGHSHDQDTQETYPMTYFTLGDHQLAMQAHVVLMTLSWIIILPIGTTSGSHVLFAGRC